MDEPHAAGEFRVKLFGWSQERRFVLVRERIRETKAAVGRRLLDVPGYTFRVWVINRSEGALELWRDYNGRACVEQRIEELKHDLAADGFTSPALRVVPIATPTPLATPTFTGVFVV